MTKRNRVPICIRCQWGYPTFMRPDYTKEIFVCPGCGYKISFKDWIVGE
jgi:DNA-directed RNA polymerase subunit RPC12/RpoP